MRHRLKRSKIVAQYVKMSGENQISALKQPA